METPGRHGPEVLYIGGLHRLRQASAEPVCPGKQTGLIGEKALGAVRQAVTPVRNRLHTGFDTDAGCEPREEEAARPEHAPHLLEHAAEVPLVGREVQDRATEDRVHALACERKRLYGGYLEVLGRELRREVAREVAYARNCTGISVHPEDLESMLEEVDQVASSAAACVEDGAHGVEAALEELVEQIDVYLSE